MTARAFEDRICASCGGAVPATANFCANCGVSFDSKLRPASDHPSFGFLVEQGFAWGIGFFLAGLMLWVLVIILLGAALRAMLS